MTDKHHVPWIDTWKNNEVPPLEGIFDFIQVERTKWATAVWLKQMNMIL